MPDGTIHAEGMASTAMSSAPPPRGALVLAGHLRAAVRAAAAVTERRKNIPILAHLLLRAEGGVLTVRGTDMEICVTATAAAQGEMAEVTCGALQLDALLARLPETAEVTLLPDGELDALRLTAPGLRARLLSQPAVDWPRIVPAKFAADFAIPAASIKRLLTLPAHAISTEETRYYLNGIFLERNTDQGGPWLTAVATDGHRLVKADEPLPEGAAAMPSVIVPRKTVARLRALLDARAGGEVRLEVGDTRIRARVGAVTVESKLIDGTFPDYRRVMPKADAATGTMRILQPRAFREAIETAAAINRARYYPVKVKGARAGITVSANDPEGDSAEVSIPSDIATWEGSEREIGFQCRYLADLARILPEGFTAGISDGSAPMRIDFPRGLAVLMPMRI